MLKTAILAILAIASVPVWAKGKNPKQFRVSCIGASHRAISTFDEKRLVLGEKNAKERAFQCCLDYKGSKAEIFLRSAKGWTLAKNLSTGSSINCAE